MRACACLQGIVHGDLTAWNVMLMSTLPKGMATLSGPQQLQLDRAGRNFVAKVRRWGRRGAGRSLHVAARTARRW